MHGGLASALGHEGKPIGFFAEEPFRIEPFGLGPASAVVVGAVEVEQNAPALGEPVAPPFELFADDGGHGREERVETAYLLHECQILAARAVGEPFPPSRISVPCVREERDLNGSSAESRG